MPWAKPESRVPTISATTPPGPRRIPVTTGIVKTSANEVTIEYTTIKSFNELGQIFFEARNRFNDMYICPDVTDKKSVIAILYDDGWRLQK